MEPIFEKRGKMDTTDPYFLTDVRNSQRDNVSYEVEVDVEFERLIINAIRNHIKQGSDQDFTVLILENLMMVYNDEELTVLHKLFKEGNKPIQRANDWCRPHLETTTVELVKKQFEVKEEKPQMVKLFWDVLI